MDKDDLLTEILLRLPAKSLTRFTSVSQKWRSLISSDYFRRRHTTTLRRPSTTASSLLVNTYDGGDVIYVDRTTKGEKAAVPLTLALPGAGGNLKYRIMSACNGLLLLHSSIRTTKEELLEEERLFINKYFGYNPTTRQSRQITLPRTDTHPYIGAYTLAFDPSKSPYYKIVSLACKSDSDSEEEEEELACKSDSDSEEEEEEEELACKSDSDSEEEEEELACKSDSEEEEEEEEEAYQVQVVVYDSEFHKQEIKQEVSACIYPDECFLPRRDAVLWNGAIYWSGNAYYDLEKNEMREVIIPEEEGEGEEYLEEIDGRLYRFVPTADYYVHKRRMDNGFEVEVWEVGDGGEKWELKRQLRVSPHPLRHEFCSYKLVRFMGDGEGEIYCLMVHSNGNMSAYSFVEDKYEDIQFPADFQQLEGYNFEWFGSKAYPFRETLALV